MDNNTLKSTRREFLGKTAATWHHKMAREALVAGKDVYLCMRTREKPVYNVLKGYQVTVAINLGVQSYREGKALAFDPARRKAVSRPPQRKVYLPAGA